MDGTQFNSDILKLFGRTDGQAAERALFQVLRESPGYLQREALKLLVGRNDVAVNARIARMLPVLDEPAFRELSLEISILEPVARAGLSDPDENVRLTLVKLMVRSGRASFAYLLAGALSDEASAVRKKAVEGLAALIRSHRSRPQELTRHIVSAVSGPLRNISATRNADLLELAVLLGRYCPTQALENLDKPAGRMSGMLSKTLQTMAAVDVGEFVIFAQKYRYIARICRSFVTQASWPDLAAIGRYSYWGLLGTVAASLGEIKNIRAVTAQPTALADLPAAEQTFALRMVMACGISSNIRRTVLATALGADRPVALAAMEPSMFGADSCADLMLLALHGHHRDVQSVATGRAISQGIDPHFTQHLLKSMESLTEPSRTVMGQFLAAQSFDRYWRSFASLEDKLRCSAGRALLKLDDCVADMLTGRLVGHDVNGQFRAVEIIRRMDAADMFAENLSRLASVGDHTVRSAAVAALAGAKKYDARDTLARRLDDSDPRVQANAIEALEALGGAPEIVLDKLDSPDSRVRANAVKWLTDIDNPQGPITLAAMLTDERPEHRISGLWVVKKLKYVHARPILQQQSKSDDDLRIRARAATVLKQLRAISRPDTTAQEAGV